MTTQRRRVAFITNIIPHYRKTFFEKLSNDQRYEWMIYRGIKNVNDGRPDYKGHIDIPQTFVENKEIGVGPYTLRWQKTLIAQLRNYSPDVVIVLGISGNISTWLILLWAKLNGIKIMMWTCGWESQADRSYSLALKRIFLKIFFSLPDHILVYSTKAQKYLIGLGAGVKKISVCYNGIEIDDLLKNEHETTCKATELRIRENSNDSGVLLYVGGMTVEKRVDLLLDAFAEIQKHNKTISLWLVGDGPARSHFEKQAADLQLRNVVFWGQIVEDVDKFFSAADYFVLPGVGGLAFNQAMFWKTPCVATEADGTEDDLVVDGFSGKRFEQDSISSLVSALHSCLAQDLVVRRMWGERCRDLIVSRSNVDSMVVTFIETLNSL